MKNKVIDNKSMKPYNSQMETKFIIDGDMPASFVEASIKLSGYWNEPIIFRLQPEDQKVPKFIKKILLTSYCEFVPIKTFRARKETTDKHILCSIQKSICEGIKEFYVFTQDYDFSFDCAHIESQNKGVKIHVVILIKDDFKPKRKQPKNIKLIKASKVIDQTIEFERSLIENENLTAKLNRF